MLDAIFWILCGGAPWRDLPERYGPWQSAYHWYRTWTNDGTFDRILERFAELQVEAIVTPDGRWHGSEAEVWDDEAWVARARQILRQYPKCLALRHVLHI
jgi:transposase